MIFSSNNLGEDEPVSDGSGVCCYAFAMSDGAGHFDN